MADAALVNFYLATTDSDDEQFRHIYVPVTLQIEALTLPTVALEDFKAAMINEARIEAERMATEKGVNIVTTRVREWQIAQGSIEIDPELGDG